MTSSPMPAALRIESAAGLGPAEPAFQLDNKNLGRLPRGCFRIAPRFENALPVYCPPSQHRFPLPDRCSANGIIAPFVGFYGRPINLEIETIETRCFEFYNHGQTAGP